MCDFQNAYAESLSNYRRTDQRAEAQALADEGYTVFVDSHEDCCGVTDAVMGVSYYIIGKYATAEEAGEAYKQLSEYAKQEIAIYRPHYDYCPVCHHEYRVSERLTRFTVCKQCGYEEYITPEKKEEPPKDDDIPF